MSQMILWSSTRANQAIFNFITCYLLKSTSLILNLFCSFCHKIMASPGFKQVPFRSSSLFVILFSTVPNLPEEFGEGKDRVTKTEEMEKHHIKVRVLELNAKQAVSTVASL